MSNRISLGDIESRLGKQNRGSNHSDPYGDAAPSRGFQRPGPDDDDDDESTLSTGFIATCVAAFLAVGGGTFFFIGGDFDMRSLTTWKSNGVYLDYASKVDGKCKQGWGRSRENKDQLYCYFTTNVARLCDPQEKGHLLNVVNLFQDGAARHSAGTFNETMKLVKNQGKMMQLGMAGAKATQENLSADERMAAETQAIGLANEIMSGFDAHIENNRNDRNYDDLKGAVRKLVERGYLSRSDFGWIAPSWVESALKGAKPTTVNPCVEG